MRRRGPELLGPPPRQTVRAEVAARAGHLYRRQFGHHFKRLVGRIPGQFRPTGRNHRQVTTGSAWSRVGRSGWGFSRFR
jgi:hypothetical protein